MVNDSKRGLAGPMRLTAFLFWFVLLLVVGGSIVYGVIAAGGR